MLPYGFRVVGDCSQERRLVDAEAAFLGYANCDDRACVHLESYLSAWCFGDDFRLQLMTYRTPKGFRGANWSPWVWIDIDREGNPAEALEATRRMVAAAVLRYGVDEDELLIFFSGSKGFHIGIPTSLWLPEPQIGFSRVARGFAETLAEAAGGIHIDTIVYDEVRIFRAPNSRHAKTGLHKRRLTADELNYLSVDRIRELAKSPESFDLPEVQGKSEQAAADWQASQERRQQVKKLRLNGTPKLNRLTLQFIKEGADCGDRHRTLFSAAANLREFGCPPELAHALLTEPGLDCGLPPSDVRRQIEWGLGRADG